ncbi:hypothetical protein [Kaarinaea lacus]
MSGVLLFMAKSRQSETKTAHERWTTFLIISPQPGPGFEKNHEPAGLAVVIEYSCHVQHLSTSLFADTF